MPPDVYSTAVSGNARTRVKTVVYVSWNGATEVASWHLFKTNERGESEQPGKAVGSVAKTAFETVIEYSGLASFVVVEARDRKGHVLGKSRLVKTIVDISLPQGVVAHEQTWLSRFRADHQSTDPNLGLLKIVGILGAIATLYFVIFRKCLARQNSAPVTLDVVPSEGWIAFVEQKGGVWREMTGF